MKALIPTACAVLMLVASTASAQETLVGVKVGGLFNQLSQPTDPAGEPTVLFGTSFTGFGFEVGGALYHELTRLGVGPLFVDADLLLAHQRASGYAESRTTSARRTVTIHTTGLRLPVLLGVGFSGSGSMFNIGVGPELLLGLAAGSKTTQENAADAGAPLSVRAVTHVGLTAHLGMMFDAHGQKFPIDARFTWDPMVAKSTRDRFKGYVDYDNTGDYAVAFNWQAGVMVGWMFDLFGAPAEPNEQIDAPPGVPEPVEPPPEETPDPEEEPDLG